MRAEAQQYIDRIDAALDLLRRFLDWDRALRRLDELNARVEDPTLWDNAKLAQEVMRERTRLDSAIGAKTVHLSHVGKVFEINDSNLSRWRIWWRYVVLDQVWLWGLGCFMGMFLNVNLARKIIPAGTDLSNIGAGAFQAQHMGRRSKGTVVDGFPAGQPRVPRLGGGARHSCRLSRMARRARLELLERPRG